MTRPGMPVTVFGDVDARAVDQLVRCADAGDAVAAAMCADGHVGYSQPIGGAIAYTDWISPSGVGYDIGCGNKAVATSLFYGDIRADLSALMDEVFDRISFGIGRRNNEPVEHAVLDRIRCEAPMPGIGKLYGRAAAQLGTVGAGNHYVDLFRDEDTDRVWIGVHFGSRGFGHAIASGFLALAQGLQFDDRGKEGEMDAPPTLLHIDSPLGHLYIEAMQLAGEYAYAGRDLVCQKVLDILGAQAMDSVHNHHNFAWRETHFGEDVWVIRKGCTPAWPGQSGFVGATMGEPSVILEGVESPDSAELLYSTVHGAGRVMSRSKAAGKTRWRWACNRRDCDWVQAAGTAKPGDGICPSCGYDLLRKIPINDGGGLVDWDAARTRLREARIELRGGAADEAPEAYKRLDTVLHHHSETIKVLHRLHPIGVAMAGPNVRDPYKD